MSADNTLPLPPGDPADLEDMARRFRVTAGDLDRTAAQVRSDLRLVGTHWRGPAAGAASASLGQLTDQTAAHPPALSASATALSTYASALREAQQQVRQLQAEWEQLAADADRRMTLTPSGASTALLAQTDQVRSALQARHANVLAELDSAGQRAGTVLQTAAAGLPEPRTIAALTGHPLPDGGVDTSSEPLIPTAGTDPKQVARWWASLTPAQRTWLTQHRYHDLRDLRGLPAVDLDEINRRRLADDLTTLKDRAAALKERAKFDPLALGAYLRLSRALNNALGVQHALDQHSGTLLITYDPYGPTGAGRAAIAYGNPDTADNTALVVPGTGNSTSNLDSPMGDGSRLRNQMDQSSPGRHNAVVVWMGYDAPDNIPEAAHDHFAQEGQGWLKDDVAGYQVAHEQATGGQHGHITVVSHSYGTYVTGLALHGGMKVDDVVFIGSPGVGVNHASDLGLDGQHVYVGRTRDDPIQIVDDRFTPHAPFGNGPEDKGFGATPFGTDDSHGHSHYYDRGSESLGNIGRVAVGQGSQVTPPNPPRTFPDDPDPGPNDAPMWPGP